MNIVKIVTATALASTLSFAAVAQTDQTTPPAAGSTVAGKVLTPSAPQSGNMPIPVGEMPIYMGQMPMGSRQMPMHRGQRHMGGNQMPMMGRGQGNCMGGGRMGMMNPQMKQQMMAMKQAHMKKMENHLANIEALLRELVEMQKRK